MTSRGYNFKAAFSEILSYSVLEKIQLFLLSLFVATLPFDQKLNSGLLILLLISLLFSFRITEIRKHMVPVGLFISGYLVSLIALSYTIDLASGKAVVERQLSLLIIPVMFFASFRFTKTRLHFILFVFFVSIVLTSLYLLKISGSQFLAGDIPASEWFVKKNLYHNFAKPIHMHATYLSLYVALAIIVGCYWLLFDYSILFRLFILCGILLLVCTLAMLSSRVVILSVFCIIFGIYPFFLKLLRHKIGLLVAGIIVFLGTNYLLRESSFLSSRFSERLNEEVRLTPFRNADSTYNPVYGGENRADRWYCAVELFKESPAIGFGTGSEKGMLMIQYSKYNMQNAMINNYDAHNQYLAFCIKTGIFGLLALVAAIVLSFYVAIRNRSFIYLSFTLLFTIACITENVLESNKGIFFYAFFNSYFAGYFIKRRPSSDFKTPRSPDTSSNLPG